MSEEKDSFESFEKAFADIRSRQNSFYINNTAPEPKFYLHPSMREQALKEGIPESSVIFTDKLPK